MQKELYVGRQQIHGQRWTRIFLPWRAMQEGHLQVRTWSVFSGFCRFCLGTDATQFYTNFFGTEAARFFMKILWPIFWYPVPIFWCPVAIFWYPEPKYFGTVVARPPPSRGISVWVASVPSSCWFQFELWVKSFLALRDSQNWWQEPPSLRGS